MMKGQVVVKVDAFTDRIYSGNPAAVCILETPRSAEWMQNVAMEMNASVTAFLQRDGGVYHLRWFTPSVEVDLCGHATLASAHVLWQDGHLISSQPAEFSTRGGKLTARRDGDWIALDFPATAPRPAEAPLALIEGLGVRPTEVALTPFDYLVEVDHADQVRALAPNFAQLERVDTRGVIVTARSDRTDFDFISRFFAPRIGLHEDPVSGSTHCALGPYWAAKLGRTRLTGYQASRRGGVIRVDVRDDRIHLSGRAVTVMRGELHG